MNYCLPNTPDNKAIAYSINLVGINLATTTIFDSFCHCH